MIKSLFKKYAPASTLRWLRRAGLYKGYQPAAGKVYSGDFERLTPFSTDFGYDRGGPIDRYYIENFLRREAGNIRGRVLEIGDNEYTLAFGGRQVEKSDILHIDENNKQATIIGDLSNAPHIPDNTFDCIVLTQTIHLIYDYMGALRTCHRILKPGGILLLTSPGITPIAYGAWKEIWYWSFTDTSLRKIMEETFPQGQFEINPYGNVYAAAAFLYGMGRQEVPQDKLDYLDQHYQVVISVKATKAATT